MNRLDKEDRIIEQLQMFDINEALMIPMKYKTFLILNEIHNESNWKNWIDSSAKNELPPDFFNPKKKLMMDVMRIDDHAYMDENGKIVNPHNRRESELIDELTRNNEAMRKAAEVGHLIVIPYTGLSGEQDHNYNYYVDNFNRVVNNHIKKIDNYRKNHPGYKTIFLVFDESSPYAKCPDEKRPTKVGEAFYAYPHLWWCDKNMINCLKNSKIEYLVWVTPYKHFDSVGKVELPKITIIDVKKIKYKKLIEYIPSDMQSLEI